MKIYTHVQDAKLKAVKQFDARLVRQARYSGVLNLMALHFRARPKAVGCFG
jgi:hypothetical protein